MSAGSSRILFHIKNKTIVYYLPLCSFFHFDFLTIIVVLNIFSEKEKNTDKKASCPNFYSFPELRNNRSFNFFAFNCHLVVEVVASCSAVLWMLHHPRPRLASLETLGLFLFLWGIYNLR